MEFVELGGRDGRVGDGSVHSRLWGVSSLLLLLLFFYILFFYGMPFVHFPTCADEDSGRTNKSKNGCKKCGKHYETGNTTFTTRCKWSSKRSIRGHRADANYDLDGWCMLANHSNDHDEIRIAFGDLALAQWCLNIWAGLHRSLHVGVGEATGGQRGSVQKCMIPQLLEWLDRHRKVCLLGPTMSQ